TEEDAEPVRLSPRCGATLPCLHLGLVSVVVLERGNLLVVADVKVVVEVAAERGHPRQGPALLRPIGLKFGQRGTGDEHKTRVALTQQRQITQGIHIARATRTSLLPSRIKHEVINDELASTGKQVGKPPRPRRPL